MGCKIFSEEEINLNTSSSKDIVLEEILILLRLALRPQIQSFLEKILPSNDERVAFQNSDVRTSNLWKDWHKQGLGDIIDTKGGGSRFVRSISLDDFGIEVD